MVDRDRDVIDRSCSTVWQTEIVAIFGIGNPLRDVDDFVGRVHF